MFESAIAHFKESADVEGLWKTHYNLAVSLGSGLGADRLTDLDLALSHLRQAIAILKSEQREIRFQVLLNFGSFAQRSEGERRQDNLREAIALVERRPAPQIWASTQNALGALKTSLRGKDVRSAWEEGLALAVRSYMNLSFARTARNCVEVYFQPFFTRDSG